MSRVNTTFSNSTAFQIEEQLKLDDQGFTEKKCRNCQMKLSYEEVFAFFTLSKQRNSDIQTINLKDKDIICLNCYAT
jgi:hypothetical protein